MCVLSTSALRSASIAAQATLIDLAVHRLLAPLDLAEIAVPARATQDVDTWHDQERLAEGRSDE